MAMPSLNYYHDLFYKDKVKIVPRNLGQLLTARGLAAGHRRAFSTCSLLFSKNSSSPFSNTDPVKFYSNAEKDKEFIYKDNRNKCGIYC